MIPYYYTVNLKHINYVRKGKTPAQFYFLAIHICMLLYQHHHRFLASARCRLASRHRHLGRRRKPLVVVYLVVLVVAFLRRQFLLHRPARWTSSWVLLPPLPPLPPVSFSRLHAQVLCVWMREQNPSIFLSRWWNCHRPHQVDESASPPRLSQIKLQFLLNCTGRGGGIYVYYIIYKFPLPAHADCPYANNGSELIQSIIQTTYIQSHTINTVLHHL